MLIFLNDVSSDGIDYGGQTLFTSLSIKITPKTGDAIMWSNINIQGEYASITEDAIHESLMLQKDTKTESSRVKYVCNVWISDTVDVSGIENHSYTTS